MSARRRSVLRLLVAVVDAGGGGVEEPLDAGLARRQQQVRVDQHGEHAQGLVVLDEAHAAHVGGEVVDRARALDGVHGRRRCRSQVGDEVLDAVGALVPLVERLDVDGADLGMAALLQGADEMAADEAAAAGDHY